MKKKEFLTIFVLTALATWGSGWLSHFFHCPKYPDAFCSLGYPLAYHKSGGFMGVNEWLWVNLISDFLFWFAILTGLWYVAGRLQVANFIKRNKFIAIFMFSVLLTSLLTGTAVYFWQKSKSGRKIRNLEKKVDSLKKQVLALKKEKASFQPTAKSSSLSDWKVFQSGKVVFRYPLQWEKGESFIGGSSFQEFFRDLEGKFILAFSVYGNYNQMTGKAYDSLDEYVNMRYNVKNYKVEVVFVDGQEARRLIPKSSSKTIASIVFFSGDRKSIYNFEMEINDRPLSASEYVKEGRRLFDQIVSTFRFTD